jgi:hypothetical protein
MPLSIPARGAGGVGEAHLVEQAGTFAARHGFQVGEEVERLEPVRLS